MLIKITTNNFQETQKLGKKLAKEFLQSTASRKKALVLALDGELGGGKTTFTQGFAKGLGIKEKILSPTFVILKRFSLPLKTIEAKNINRNDKALTLYHIDCYRLQRSEELLNLGFKEISDNPQNIVLIEWADKVKEILSEDTIFLKFEFINRSKRKIVLTKLGSKEQKE